MSEDAAAAAFCPKDIAKPKDKLGPNMQQKDAKGRD